MTGATISIETGVGSLTTYYSGVGLKLAALFFSSLRMFSETLGTVSSGAAEIFLGTVEGVSRSLLRLRLGDLS